MYKEFNNYYIKTLVRLSKELGCYDEVNNNIKVIFDCIKSTEKPFFPHVILGEMKFNSFSQKMSLKIKYLERITPQLACDIYTMISNEADYRKDIVNFEAMKSGIIDAIKNELIYSYCNRYINGGRKRLIELKTKYIYKL